MRVVNIRDGHAPLFNAGMVQYVGRPSVYGNPITLSKESDRDDVLEQFACYWYAPEQKWLREKALKEITASMLGCFCYPKRCHADIIAGYLEWKRSNKISA